MARRGGFQGGMPGNMNNLMKQAQKMQRQMEVTQKEMEEKEYEATAGGGAVTVKVSGKKEVLSVKLSEEVVDPDDIEMLEDLIVAATNEALRQLEEDSAKSMEALTGGLNLGGGFPFSCTPTPSRVQISSKNWPVSQTLVQSQHSGWHCIF